MELRRVRRRGELPCFPRTRARYSDPGSTREVRPKPWHDARRFRPLRRFPHRTTRGYLTNEAIPTSMSPNKKLIETYMTTVDRSKAAESLADDVEWIEWGDGVPATGVRTQGKAAFIQNFGDDELRTQITRMTEENNVVVVEGTVHVHKKEGRDLTLQYCNIFELENGKVKRLNSFGALIKDSP